VKLAVSTVSLFYLYISKISIKVRKIIKRIQRKFLWTKGIYKSWKISWIK